jgi:hypothetical protein
MNLMNKSLHVLNTSNSFYKTQNYDQKESVKLDTIIREANYLSFCCTTLTSSSIPSIFDHHLAIEVGTLI